MIIKVMSLFCLLMGFTGLIIAAEETWLSIDTSSATLLVKRGDHVMDKFNNISIGRGGVSERGFSGDDRTPLGTFSIAWINNHSPFNRFFGLNYPTKAHALSAYAEGLIDEPTYNSIASAIHAGRLPPQETYLGGYLGIHGLGKADRRVHRLFNWTHGCIALTNQQIDRLSRWIFKGMKVVIH